MKNIMVGLMAVVALTFGSGCGGDACDDLEDAGNSLEDKLEDCSDGNGGGEDEDFDGEACKEALEDCSDADEEKLSDYANCLSDLPDCKEGQEADWLSDFTECAEELEGLSAACAASGG
ncbi:MAG TPA: hypothetical protein VE153_11335 [Myxococcus sp.]|jgi:hypothetical protein|nr:hypothetical protein [Myxococcus sp.]